MADLTVKRTLVKSPPELWAEVSEVESLARHLGEFGEIRIERLDPETTVAWEGEHARGTVEIEASGWGTKVTLNAEVPEPEAHPEPEPAAVAEQEPIVAEEQEAIVAQEQEPILAEEQEPIAAEPEPEPIVVAPPKPRGFFARWLFRDRRDTLLPAPPPEPDQGLDEVLFGHQARAVAPPPEPEPEPEPAPEPEPEPAPEAVIDEERAKMVLESVLDSLGAAHHRPFSRG